MHIKLYKREDGKLTLFLRRTRPGEGKSHIVSKVEPLLLRRHLEEGVQRMLPMKQLSFSERPPDGT